VSIIPLATRYNYLSSHNRIYLTSDHYNSKSSSSHLCHSSVYRSLARRRPTEVISLEKLHSRSQGRMNLFWVTLCNAGGKAPAYRQAGPAVRSFPPEGGSSSGTRGCLCDALLFGSRKGKEGRKGRGRPGGLLTFCVCKRWLMRRGVSASGKAHAKAEGRPKRRPTVARSTKELRRKQSLVHKRAMRIERIINLRPRHWTAVADRGSCRHPEQFILRIRTWRVP